VIVVADTSVVLNLACIGQDKLLRDVHGDVIVPRTVMAEFKRLCRSEPRFVGLAFPSWIIVFDDPPNAPQELLDAGLDAGETTAISLCIEQKADAVLIDETLGRAVAAKLGLRVIGIVGTLILAKKRGHIRAVQELLNRLESEAGFWLAPKLRALALETAGE
jgi:uncharacterized protein